MPPTALNLWLQAAGVFLGLVWLVLAGKVYHRLVARLREAGGQVTAEKFLLPDLLVSVVLASFFAGLVIKSALRPDANSMAADQVLPSALILAAFVGALGLFLKYRRVRLTELFGFSRVSFLAVCGWAALLLGCALPFVWVVSVIIVQVMKGAAEPQPLVELFRSAAQHGDFAVMASIVFAGVIVAPICEEFLFRGYFYGVGKRYLGGWVSGLITAALFAAFHASLTSFAGLFVLAIALTLAYERTGSLAVPMTMHALFNSISLGVMYLQATNRLPA